MEFIVWLVADAVAVAPPMPTTPMATEVERATAPRETLHFVRHGWHLS
jgi:hypothetical protein